MEQQQQGGGLETCKIFVGGLSWQTTEESLRYHFERFGEVVSVEVMRDRNTGDPRGFAFVVFSNPATVDLVMKDKGNHEINHKMVDVKRAQARGMAPPSIHGERKFDNNTAEDASADAEGGDYKQKSGGGGAYHAAQNNTPEILRNKIFVGGLHLAIDKDEMKEFFEQFGPVVDTVVMQDQMTGRSRGFGFVTFEDGSNGAQKALDAQPLNIRNKYVEIKLAQPKEAAAGPLHSNKGLRGFKGGMLAAGLNDESKGEFYGLAASYGRNGWKAGYGSKAFGKAIGWGVPGWEDSGVIPDPEISGFSFSMLAVLPIEEQQDGSGREKKRRRD